MRGAVRLQQVAVADGRHNRPLGVLDSDGRVAKP